MRANGSRRVCGPIYIIADKTLALSNSSRTVLRSSVGDESWRVTR
jgi:hypothetical protein